jgi:hypothetical protein
MGVYLSYNSQWVEPQSGKEVALREEAKGVVIVNEKALVFSQLVEYKGLNST